MAVYSSSNLYRTSSSASNESKSSVETGGPHTPQPDFHPNSWQSMTSLKQSGLNGSSLYSTDESSTYGKGSLGGGQSVLERQARLLERSTSVNSLARSGSVSSLRNSTSNNSLMKDFGVASSNNGIGNNTFTRGHRTNASVNSLADSISSTSKYTPTSSYRNSVDLSGLISPPLLSSSRYKKADSDFTYQRTERTPLTNISSSIQSTYTSSGSTSAPPTPSHRVSRFDKGFSTPRNEESSSPTLRAFPSYDASPSSTFTLSRTPTSASRTSSDYETPLKRSDSIEGYSSVVSASNRTHRHTKSVPSLNASPAPVLSSVLGLPLHLDRYEKPSNGHGNRNGLDRLSEHYDQEDPAYVAPPVKSPPIASSPLISSLRTGYDSPRNGYDSPKATWSPSTTTPHSPASPSTHFYSPNLDAEREKHMPGSATGEVATHRGRGAEGRVKLSRKPTISSYGMVLPSNSVRAMDISRHHVAAYEYLNHVAEAQAWLDQELQRDPDYDASAPEAPWTSSGATQFEQALRNGVALAKLARVFEGRKAVPRIYTHPKLSWHHTDNINYFFSFIRRRGLPDTYIFETTDLYDANNMPKVIYCIHAINAFLVAQGQAERIRRVRNLEFSADQLDATKKGIDHLVMPNFKGIAKDLKIEEPEPEPEPETEEERMTRLLHEAQYDLAGFTAQIRGALARKRFERALTLHRRIHKWAVKLQAVSLGSLARMRYYDEQQQRRIARKVLPGFQAHARAALARRRVAEIQSGLQLHESKIVKTQAKIRGILARRKFWKPIQALDGHDQATTLFQARIRGMLERKKHQQLTRDVHHATRNLTMFQAAARRVLAERKLLERIRTLRSASSQIVGIQAAARGLIARRRAQELKGQLHRASIQQTVGGLQSLARAALVRKKLLQQHKDLSFRSPDITGVQAQIRGILARDYYYAWLHHLRSNQGAAVFIQSLMRGHLARMRFWRMLDHYREHMEKVVKVQAIFRRKQQAQQYKQLTMGQNVPIGTVKNFLHLLQDSDFDYAEDIKVEELRKQVVQAIRDNQAIDNEVNELDTKIALLVKNKITLDELLRTRKANPSGSRGHSRHDSVLRANKDPFATDQMDKQSRHKLELYQELFYILQTQPEYLARLFRRLGVIDFSEKDRRDVERIVLTLFGFAQNAREEFLLLKLFQRSLHEEILAVNALQDFIRTDFLFIKLIVQYGRADKERQYFVDMLSPHVQTIVDDESIDLETDPIAVYKAMIAQEETRTGLATSRPRDVDARQALGDKATRDTFIAHLQQLRALTDVFLQAIMQSTPKMPYGIRWIAREMFQALQAKFHSEPQEALIRVVCHFVYYRYINAAIVAPEQLGIIHTVIAPAQRRALSEISKLLNQIAAGRLFDARKDPTLEPLNHYIAKASHAFSLWMFDLINVPDAEEKFPASSYFDHTENKRPRVYISPNEIYFMQRTIESNLRFVCPANSDRLAVVLQQLGSAPAYANEELSKARAGEIILELKVKNTSLANAQSEEEALWVSTKRFVLAILKIQPGENLLQALTAEVTNEHEQLWDRVRYEDTASSSRAAKSSPHLGQLEDFSSITFRELKVRALENVLRLERLGRIRREDKMQEVLNAIAKDIRLKHRKRMQRQAEIASMESTIGRLGEKRKFLDSQLASYNEYVESTQATMHKKSKKRLTIPFTTQFFHERSLARKGAQPKFGSYVYNAAKLHQDGVLISLDQIPIQRFDQVKIVISCDQVGVFDFQAETSGVKVADVKIEYSDLLDAQFNNRQTYSISDVADVNLNLLLYLIHKKFFV